MIYMLRMSEEIRTWLHELRSADPRSAMLAGQALVALLDQRGSLGPPVTVPVAGALPADELPELLDREYQRRLDRVQEARRQVAAAALAGEPAESLIAEQDALAADADTFRARKELLRARFLAADALHAIEDSPAAADELAQAVGQLRQELGDQALVDGLFELRPGAPGDADVVLFYAIEPPGAALLISVLEGADAIGQRREEAIAISAEVLHGVRAGRDRDAGEHAYDTAAFLREFFPDDAQQVRAGADALAGGRGGQGGR